MAGEYQDDVVPRGGRELEASRDNLLQAADKVYDSINGTLENSLNSLFGRFKDQVPNNPIMPKTLEEARKLVSTPPATTPEDEYPPNINLSGRSSPDDPLSQPTNAKTPTSGNNRPLELLAGRGPAKTRDRSADSTRSAASSTTSGTPVVTNRKRRLTESGKVRRRRRVSDPCRLCRW